MDIPVCSSCADRGACVWPSCRRSTFAKVDVLSSVDEQRLHARFALRAAGLLQHGSLCATAGCSELRDLGRLGESCGLLLMAVT